MEYFLLTVKVDINNVHIKLYLLLLKFTTKITHYNMKIFNLFLIALIILIPQINGWSQDEKEVKVKTQFGKLYGTLTNVPHKKHPTIAIIIPGSGAIDRNGNGGIIQANSYQMLAHGLAGRGIANLRYDKLGVGESKTDRNEKDMRFEDNVIQVNAWIDYLKKKGYEDIVLIGHSEGALVGLLAAQEREVRGLVSLEGAGRSIDKVLVEQIEAKSPEYASECKDILAKLKEGQEVANFSPELANIFRTTVQPYLISWIQYDPKKEISQLDIPILIIQGTTDLQVSKEDAEALKEGNPKAKLIEIIGMNHILKSARKEREKNIQTYYDPYLPLHTALIPAILKYVDQRKDPNREEVGDGEF